MCVLLHESFHASSEVSGGSRTLPNACFTRRCGFQFHGGPNPVPRNHATRRPLDSGCAAMASAERVGSWIRRLSHHRVVSGKRSDAQTHPTRTHRRAWKLQRTRQPPHRGARYGAQCNGISVTALAEAVGSWIKRLSRHRVMSGERSDAQTHPVRPYRRVWKLRCTRRPSAVGAQYGARSNGNSVTVSAEAVGSWIRRLVYHLMVSGNTCEVVVIACGGRNAVGIV